MAFKYLPTRFQQSDTSGYPIVGSKAFYRTGTSQLITIYSDADLSATLTNPVNADSNGRFPAIWFADTNIVEGVKVVYFDEPNGTGAIVYSDDPIFQPPAQPYYPLSTSEQSAGITPTTYHYPPGDIRRYGGVDDNSTDNRTALQTAEDAALLIVPKGVFLARPDDTSPFDFGNTTQKVFRAVDFDSSGNIISGPGTVHVASRLSTPAGTDIQYVYSTDKNLSHAAARVTLAVRFNFRLSCVDGAPPGCVKDRTSHDFPTPRANYRQLRPTADSAHSQRLCGSELSKVAQN